MTDPLETGICLILENPKGKKYNLQTGGVACNQRSIRGDLIVLQKHNDFSIDVFRPDWWYNKFTLVTGLLSTRTGYSIEIAGHTLKTLDFFGSKCTTRKEIDTQYKIAMQIYQKMETLPSFLTWEKITAKVEKALKQIIPLDAITNIFIESPFCIDRYYAYRSEEAWVRVSVSLKDGTRRLGIVTWQNCD